MTHGPVAQLDQSARKEPTGGRRRYGYIRGLNPARTTVSLEPQAGLDGPSRTIRVEPMERPAVTPREEPAPEREPAREPEREKEPVPA